MGYRVRPSAHGGDRRFGRSLAETLARGRSEEDLTDDETYDEATGPSDRTRRPPQNEWEPDDVYMPENMRIK